MMFEFNMAELLRHRWGRLRLYRFPGSVLTDYRILNEVAH
ncbi:YlcG family protein [Escherichia coli]|nr:YlcG family protein [Escherichia coli]MBZ8250025.1 YlcG family protein [Escherichia coli]MBZ8264688.1 YlcG family protein [Escherichia coli]UIU71368.1 YlcG family protein [Escherichia coli]